MPIYRGAQKVIPRRGAQALSRVYRGDTLVWEAVPPVVYPVSGVWEGGIVPDAGNPPDPDLFLWLHEHTVAEAGDYRIQFTATWTVANGIAVGVHIPSFPFGFQYRKHGTYQWPGTFSLDTTLALTAGALIRFFAESAFGVSESTGGPWTITKL